MDRINADRARGAVFAAAHGYLKKGESAKAVAVLREALGVYANDAGMLCELAFALSFEEGGLSEAARLCEATLERKASEKLKHTARAVLCLLYRKSGDAVRAEALARTLPHVRESREEIEKILAQPDAAREEYLRYLILGEY